MARVMVMCAVLLVGCYSPPPDPIAGTWGRVSSGGVPIIVQTVDRLLFRERGEAERQYGATTTRGRWELPGFYELVLHWPDGAWDGQAVQSDCPQRRCLTLTNADTDDVYEELVDVGGQFYPAADFASATDGGRDVAGIEADHSLGDVGPGR